MPISKAIIIGGGIAGVAAAIALTKYNNINVQIIELRDSPATIGGAINLTPVAMRYLAHLGVADKLIPLSCEVPSIEIYAMRTAKFLGEINYDNVEKFKFRGRRVLRSTLLKALLNTLSELGVEVEYGRRAESIAVDSERVEVTFVDGGKAHGDILIGADGIHSFTRSTVVEPDRKPVYTGIAGAYGLIDASLLSKHLPSATSMFSGRKGSLLMSYYDEAKTKIYAAGVMETAEAESREGWKVKNGAKDALKADMIDRFGQGAEPIISEILEKTQEWFLFPVFKLQPRGKWFNERCLLIGDAAHAMPPQGESIGIALEDVVLLSRILEKSKSEKPIQIFEEYDRIRRASVEKAYEAANWGWEKVKDKGFIAGIMMEWLTGIFLWWTKKSKEEELAFDVRDIALDA